MRDIINTLDNQVATIIEVARDLRNHPGGTVDNGKLSNIAAQLEEVARVSTRQIDELRAFDSDTPPPIGAGESTGGGTPLGTAEGSGSTDTSVDGAGETTGDQGANASDVDAGGAQSDTVDETQNEVAEQPAA